MRGYDNYRGRGSSTKKIAVIVMVIILLLAGVYLFLSEFTEYDSSGGAHIVLPWQRETAEEPHTDDRGESENISIIYDDTEEPLPEVQAVEFSVSEARQGDAAIRAKLGGGNAAALYLKRPDGCLRYHSAAAGPELCFTDGLTEAELKRFTGDELYTIARLSCVKDDTAPMQDMAALALTQENGYVWYGSESEHYLDLSKDEAREYLISIVEELAGLGFDEVLLSDLAWPTGGTQANISTTGDRTATVTAFLKELGNAVEDSDLVVSLELPEATVLAGGNAAEGFSLAEQLPLVQRVYVKTERADAVQEAMNAVRRGVSLVIIDGTGTNRYIPMSN